MQSSSTVIGIVGGGPAGSVAALCLRRLGHNVILFERQKFPRYRIGESLLPGTMSILKRLGVFERIAAANFPVKRAATFLWGEESWPLSFTFSTPKTSSWIFDHAYQVTRSEFDQILLDSATACGAEVRREYAVKDVTFGVNGDRIRLDWKNGDIKGTLDVDYLIDASGASGLLAQKYQLRHFDKFYSNLAVWSYFRGGRRYKGSLEGNIFSVAFNEGWMWIIPQKNNLYSVGVVTDLERGKARMKQLGLDAFFRECLEMSPFTRELLESAEQCDRVRLQRDWSYSVPRMTVNKAFLCGDAACFIDPLFSQGVHLATYSAVLASAAIDHCLKCPEDSDDVHKWYTQSYQNAYKDYYRFLSSFYAYNNVATSHFWSKRIISGSTDAKFAPRQWLTSMRGNHNESEIEISEQIKSNVATLGDLWRHRSKELSDEFDETELSLRRLKWANELLRDCRRIRRMEWIGKEVCLIPSFKVHPTEFRLERTSLLGNETGRVASGNAFTESHRKIFEELVSEPLSFSDLTKRLVALKTNISPDRLVIRLIEEGLLQGFDENGKHVNIKSTLRFRGVGADDDFL